MEQTMKRTNIANTPNSKREWYAMDIESHVKHLFKCPRNLYYVGKIKRVKTKDLCI